MGTPLGAGAFPAGADLYVPVPLPPPLGGVVTSRPADQIEDFQLASAQNMVVRDGVVIQREGTETKIGQALTVDLVGGHEFVPFDDSARLVVAGTDALYYYDATGNDWENISATALTASASNRVSFAPIRTSTGLPLVFTNGTDTMKWWNGDTGSTFVEMQTALTAVGTLTVMNNHLLCGDIDGPDGHIAARMQWSALGDPPTFSGTSSTGFLDLIHHNASKIQTFEPLNRTTVAYKEVGTHAVLYRAAPLYFTQAPLDGLITCISRDAVAPIRSGQQHVVVGIDDVIRWDGQNVRSLNANDTKLYDDLNWEARATLWAAYNAIDREVLIGVPTGSSTTPDVCWVYDVDTDSWWETDLGLFNIFPAFHAFTERRMLACRVADDAVYHLFSGLGDTTAGTAISSSVQTKIYDFGAMSQQKHVRNVGIMIGRGTGSTSTVTLQRARQDKADIEPSFDTGNSFTSTTAETEIKDATKHTGKYMSYRVSHTAANETWEMRRLVPYLAPGTTQRNSR